VFVRGGEHTSTRARRRERESMRDFIQKIKSAGCDLLHIQEATNENSQKCIYICLGHARVS